MKGRFLATSMLLCTSTMSLAQTSFDVPGAFARIDLDRDGRITPDEIRRDAGTDFDTFDLDRDGLLSREEIREQQRLHLQKSSGRGVLTAAQFEQMAASAFEYFDFDRDGRVTREDYIQRGISQIMQADSNHDGAVTRDELHRFHGQTAR